MGIASGSRGRRCCEIVAVCVFVLASGCGPRDTRIRNRVSGTITHAGKPVVAGEILLVPDGEKRNSGPEGLALIENGRFDTRGSRAPGVDGGPMVVEVTGYMDERRSRAFMHSFKAELDRLPAMTLDIKIDGKVAPIVAADAPP